ncbi:MAG: phosphatase PAP2 family protein [Acidobacteria bacterium]|nr:MAG: phosphatase PAP2 family protein [Acidobacteriota bacterium]
MVATLLSFGLPRPACAGRGDAWRLNAALERQLAVAWERPWAQLFGDAPAPADPQRMDDFFGGEHLSALAGGPSHALAEDAAGDGRRNDAAPAVRSFHRRFVADVKDLVASPLRMNGRQWRRVGAGLLVVGTVSLLDHDVRDLIHGNDGVASAKLATSLRPIGDRGGLLVLGAVGLSGRVLKQPQLVAVAADGFEASLLAAGVISPLLKQAVGRARPRQDAGAQAFDDGASFPSGEVTQIFTLASVVSAHFHHRRWVRALAWSLAGTIAYQRMQSDAHWASDVVAGGLIGTAVGRWVVHRNRPDLRSGPRWSLNPHVAAKRYGIGVRVSF